MPSDQQCCVSVNMGKKSILLVLPSEDPLELAFLVRIGVDPKEGDSWKKITFGVCLLSGTQPLKLFTFSFL
jgi:hypothetical protein